MNIKMQLIHYGANYYRPELFKPISDKPFFIKPQGGLWTSPIKAEYGWKEWCIDNDFGNLDKSFEIEFKGTILLINNEQDMLKLPWIKCNGIEFPSFQALCPMDYYHYDAIHLTTKGEEQTRLIYPKSLYGWDCETVFILNPASIGKDKS